MTLSSFTWIGWNKQGFLQKGEISALNIRFARAELEKNSITIKKIKKKNGCLSVLRCEKINDKEIALFFRQLSTLLSSSLPLSKALKTIELGPHHLRMKNILEAAREQIRAGKPLSSSLQQLDNVTCQLIAAGEQSGQSERILDRIATHKEKIIRLKSKIKKAFFTPLITLIFSLLTTIILFISIIPQFAQLFEEAGASLPASTRLVLKISHMLKYDWLFLLLFIITPFGLCNMVKIKSKALNLFIDRLILKTPLFGKLMQKWIITRLARTLAIGLSAGTPILDLLQNLTLITNNHAFSEGLSKTRTLVQKGQPLHTSLQKTQLFPPIAIQMVAIGEEAGKLDIMLEKVSDCYEAETDEIIDRLNQLLEPFLVMILGIIVGSIMIAIYLPLFQLGIVIQ